MAEVSVQIGDQSIVSIITSSSARGNGTVPVQLMYSNRVHGPEGVTALGAAKAACAMSLARPIA